MSFTLKNGTACRTLGVLTRVAKSLGPTGELILALHLGSLTFELTGHRPLTRSHDKSGSV